MLVGKCNLTDYELTDKVLIINNISRIHEAQVQSQPGNKGNTPEMYDGNTLLAK
jgi:hypothetical protein